ncbi:hypothetical protein MesoLj113b_30510 [Mesorhizobium sp. 113-3-3]|nr:hypothetical protein MesoLj113b_30510 [Mesorhizobium sp. 113-3-3]
MDKATKFVPWRITLLACLLTFAAAGPSLALRREAYSADVVLSMAGQLERATARCATFAPCWVVVPGRVVVTIYAYPPRNSFYIRSAISADADDYGLCTGGLFQEAPGDQGRVALQVCRTRPKSDPVGVVYIRINN